MIEPLREEDFEEALQVYHKGLRMQTPAPDFPINLERKNLKKKEVLVHKSEGVIDGMILYDIEGSDIVMNFICALTPRKGIGKALMHALAIEAQEKGTEQILSNVSLEDTRAIKFYESLSFKVLEKRKEHGLELHYLTITPESLLQNTNLA